MCPPYLSIRVCELRCLKIFCSISRMWNSKTFNFTQPTGRKCSKTMAWTMALASSPSPYGAICSAVWWGSYCPSVGPHSSSLLQKVIFIVLVTFIFLKAKTSLCAVKPVVTVLIQSSSSVIIIIYNDSRNSKKNLESTYNLDTCFFFFARARVCVG